VLVRGLWLSVCAALATAASPGALATRPFTVADSIGWTHVATFSSLPLPNPPADTVLFSPQGSQFVLHIRRGDIGRNVNIESLLLFKTSEVERYLHSAAGTQPPAPVTLAQINVRQDFGEMRSIQWIGEASIGFIAQGEDGVTQAFLTDARTCAVSQLTRSKTPVQAFAVSGDTVLYYANEEIRQQPMVSVVSEKSLAETLFGNDDPQNPAILLFRLSRATGRVQRVNVPKMRLIASLQRIWISDAGDHAIIFTPSTDVPALWADYRIPMHDELGYTLERVRSDPTSLDLMFHARYTLVDLKRNMARPLLNAPAGFTAGTAAPQEVFWSADGRTAIVSDTFLPLIDVDRNERVQRTQRPAIAQVDLQTGETTPIFWEAVLADAERAAGKRLAFVVAGIEWSAEQNILKVTKRRRDPPQIGTKFVFETEAFQKKGGRWRPVRMTNGSAAARNFSVDLRQNLNGRPKVHVTDAAGEKKILLDPNPQAETFRFGRMEVFEWMDSKERIEWKGALVYPTGYVAGRRYPLVVQTHGFDPELFLINGPGDVLGYGTAMAAQALANAGFIVLQVEDRPVPLDGEEGPRHAAGYRAGIERLVSDGMADTTKVGLIAFSRTGYYLLSLLAEYPDLLAAANISDSVQPGYWQRLLAVNDDAVGVELAKMNGGNPNLDRMGEWFAANPMYQMRKAGAALRIEAIGPSSLLGMWEIFATLKGARRPVDFIYFPEGSHVLQKPMERFGSQNGNVDWFRFWLQDYERSQPVVDAHETRQTLAAQYARWRELKKLRHPQ
jgi:hypothetical protein